MSRRLSVRQRWIAAVPLVLSLILGVAAAEARPPGNEVCQMVHRVLANSLNSSSNVGDEISTKDIRRMFEQVDFDLLVSKAPASLQDEVERLRVGAPVALRVLSGKSKGEALDPRLVPDAKAVSEWATSQCR